ncbi:hypothetical protein AUP68_11309 [Ilyonectria robusta]
MLEPALGSTSTCTLCQKTHSLAGLKTSSSRRYMSPMKKFALAQEGNTIERMETIQAYTLPPWHSRLPIG